MAQTPTAGDLIRKAVQEGESKRGLARRLASSDDHREVERWRSIVGRAVDKDAEPEDDHVPRIAEVFGVEVSAQPAEDRRSRQARLEAEVAALRVVAFRLIQVSDLLVEQVEVLGGTIPADAVEELAQAGRRLQRGGQPS